MQSPTSGKRAVADPMPGAPPAGSCDTPHCTEPGRIYPGGLRCDTHKPKPILWSTP